MSVEYIKFLVYFILYMKLKKEDIIKLIKENRELKIKQEKLNNELENQYNLNRKLKQELIIKNSTIKEQLTTIQNIINENNQLGEKILNNVNTKNINNKDVTLQKSGILDSESENNDDTDNENNDDTDNENNIDIEDSIKNDITLADKKYTKDKQTYYNKIKKVLTKHKQVFYTAQQVNSIISTGMTIIKFGSYITFLI